MAGLPKIYNYGNYSSDNYGAHSLAVDIGPIEVYFSYQTPIAFRYRHGLVCSENAWSTTTGKHLNWIQPDKKQRVPHEEFKRLLQEALAEMEVNPIFDKAPA